ncbi:hypothetical protein B0H14DRAFT_3533636 [Mycena olivaceomarginata]|nr:hypothetical protein B0H14DRAFT_3533636 [Mycena olivaceomarginata]
MAKYPLAMIDTLLDALGDRLGAGYDIGCYTAATISKRAFHGHGHNRLCQLKYLTTYSNALAKAVHYASRFYRQQEIMTYMKTFDMFETYTNLSKFLCNNYHQALGILATEPTLRQWMHREGVVSTEEFEKWLAEEKEWLMLKKNSKKSQETSLEMEYVQKLVNLSSNKAKLLTLRREGRTTDSDYNPSKDAAAQQSRRHAEEIRNRDLASVIDIEEWLEIIARWISASLEWAAAVKLVKEKKFTDALNELELLIVEPYKMRTHIAKALQARSMAIKNAISRYNTAAFALEPPAPSFTWDQVVEYAFLADFNFLRATDGELLNKLWS